MVEVAEDDEDSSTLGTQRVLYWDLNIVELPRGGEQAYNGQ